MGGQGLNPLSLGGSENVGAEESESTVTEDLDTRTHTASYVVYTDETDITAVPQQNPADASLSRVTGTSIGNVLTEIILNQLPPQGDQLEANGTIFLRRGKYPGDLSDGDDTLNGVVVPSGCRIVGEGVTHNDLKDNSTVPTTEPPTQLEFTTNGFVAPNTDSDFMIFPEFRNLNIVGPGNADNGSIAFDNDNSNGWDWCLFDSVVVQQCDVPYQASSLDRHMLFRRCIFIAFAGTMTVTAPRHYFHQSNIVISNGAQLDVRRGRFSQCQIEGPGGSKDAIDAVQSTFVDCRFENQDGSVNNGTFLRTNDVAIIGCRVVDGDWGNIVKHADNTTFICWLNDETTSINALTLESGSGGKIMLFGDFPNGVVNETRADKAFLNGHPIIQADLTTVTGDYTGELAIADGTSTGASAGDLARWEGSQWRIWNADATE